MVPTAERAAFEMVPAEFVLEFSVLLFDRPAAPRERDQRFERGRGIQIEHVGFPFVLRQGPLAEQPALAATPCGPPAEADHARRHRPLAPESPPDPSPRPTRNG